VISFEDAKRIALARVREGCVLVESATIEKPFGWCFQEQTRAFLETGDTGKALFGGGNFIVDREDGHVFRIGTALPKEHWIANYERGFKYARYDLCILTVADLEATTRLLGRLNLQFVIPEEDNGTVWTVPQPYVPEHLREMLGRLPCVFSDQALTLRAHVFGEIDASACCRYQLREHVAE
jgi:Immunity protein 35